MAMSFREGRRKDARGYGVARRDASFAVASLFPMLLRAAITGR
jgi:hypothetical protein